MTETSMTKNWAIGILLSVVITMGGYIYSRGDLAFVAAATAQAEINATFNQRMTTNEIADAARSATSLSQYTEIIQRLERIERGVDANRRGP